MAIDRYKMYTVYRNFIDVVEMTTSKLMRSDFTIHKPFDSLKELLNSSELTKTSLPLSQRVGFINWCNNYNENVINEIQKVNADIKIVEHDDCWEVFTPSAIVGVKQNEIFNTIAHKCGSPIWDGVHFGEVDSPLKFDDFIGNFEHDDWTAIHGQLRRYALRIWEDIYLKIDDVQQVCDKLDSLGKSEHIFEDCRNRVFSE